MAYKINGTTVVDNSRNVCACCVTSCCITASSRMDAPSGTTAQRPSSPATGSIYFDTDVGSLISYNGTDWATVGGGAQLDEFSNEYYSTLHMFVCSRLCKSQNCFACSQWDELKQGYLEASSLTKLIWCEGSCSIYCKGVGNCSCIAFGPPGGYITNVPGEVTFCYRGGFGGNCSYVSNTVLGSCYNRQYPCYPNAEQHSWHTLPHSKGMFFPIIDGSGYGHIRRNLNTLLQTCGNQVNIWTESYITPKGGVYTKNGGRNYPTSCSCTSICGLNPSEIYVPTYLYPQSCLGPIQATPMSANAMSPSSHKWLAYPLMYITCTDSNFFTDEEELCCYAFLFGSCSQYCSPSDHFPYYWGNNYCMCLCCQCSYIVTAGLGYPCWPTSGIPSCGMPFFTYRSDLSSKPDHFNKEMYTCTVLTCDGLNVKTFDPSCCPALWWSISNASCRCEQYICYPSAINGMYHTIYWDCGGDVAWMFKYVCYAQLCAFATCGPTGYQCVSCCQCCGRFEQSCILTITKFCRPCLSFEYWSPKQPRCFMPWQCCKGCTHLCHMNNLTPCAFCSMGFIPQGTLGFKGGDACSQTTRVTQGLQSFGATTPMADVQSQKVIQHPTCSNWLLIFGNGNYTAHSSSFAQRQRQAPVYSVFNKSTKQFVCSINFDALINYNTYGAHLAKWYTMTPGQLCSCLTACCTTLACLFLGQNVANPQSCFAACIQSITGNCCKSIIHHCQGHDLCYYPGCLFGGLCGTDLNLVGMGSFSELNWYYNPCSDHIVFVGGLTECGFCNCYVSSCHFQWVGAICFDLNNCCITKVNQIYPSTDPCVNCKIIDPAAVACRPVHRMCFLCVLGMKTNCDYHKVYGLSLARYGSDKTTAVGGVHFLFGGIQRIGCGENFTANCCCLTPAGSCYFGCGCTGACSGMTSTCCGCVGTFMPVPHKAKVPYDIPLECVGFNTSTVFKNFWALRWLAGLQYNPWGASAACQMQLTACVFTDTGPVDMPFYPGWCCLCCGGCYKANTATVGGPTMNCCCMWSVTRTYLENQIVAGQNCIFICGNSVSLCCRPCDLFKHCCLKYRWDCCTNVYCRAIISSVVQLYDNLAPCHFAADADKRYSKYLKLKNNFSPQSYSETGELSVSKPFKLNVGEDYMDGAIRIYNEGIACTC